MQREVTKQGEKGAKAFLDKVENETLPKPPSQHSLHFKHHFLPTKFDSTCNGP